MAYLFSDYLNLLFSVFMGHVSIVFAFLVGAFLVARKLNKAMDENRLSRAIHNFTRPSILVIDEIGYLELSRVQASLLFQVISKRYE